MKSIISERDAPLRTTSRSECSTVEKRHVRIWPSAVSLMREQAPQKGSDTGAIIPISPVRRLQIDSAQRSQTLVELLREPRDIARLCVPESRAQSQRLRAT